MLSQAFGAVANHKIFVECCVFRFIGKLHAAKSFSEAISNNIAVKVTKLIAANGICRNRIRIRAVHRECIGISAITIREQFDSVQRINKVLIGLMALVHDLFAERSGIRIS